jgi:hypothetical protein
MGVGSKIAVVDHSSLDEEETLTSDYCCDVTLLLLKYQLL